MHHTESTDHKKHSSTSTHALQQHQRAPSGTPAPAVALRVEPHSLGSSQNDSAHPPNGWDLDHIKQIVAQNDLERGRIEYKTELGNNGDTTLAAIAALANTFGGVVLVGIDERQPPGPGRIVGVESGRRDPTTSPKQAAKPHSTCLTTTARRSPESIPPSST